MIGKNITKKGMLIFSPKTSQKLHLTLPVVEKKQEYE